MNIYLNIRQPKYILNFETCGIITRKSDAIDSGIIQIIFHGAQTEIRVKH